MGFLSISSFYINSLYLASRLWFSGPSSRSLKFKPTMKTTMTVTGPQKAASVQGMHTLGTLRKGWLSVLLPLCYALAQYRPASANIQFSLLLAWSHEQVCISGFLLICICYKHNPFTQKTRTGKCQMSLWFILVTQQHQFLIWQCTVY